MITEKNITVEEHDAQFITEFDHYGFQSVAELLSRALELLRDDIKHKQELESSAALYAETYATDSEAQEWVKHSVSDWE